MFFQGREGEIRHLFRSFAFLHCKKLVENGGMFVCKTRHLVLAGGSKVRWAWWHSVLMGIWLSFLAFPDPRSDKKMGRYQ